ncbi:MAG: RNA methyltransferase [Alphaproteobacteria bacterium]
MASARHSRGKGKPGRPWASKFKDQPAPDPNAPVWIYGHHPVAEALRNARRTRLRLVASRNAARELPPGTEAEILEPRAIDALLPPGAVHQGIALLSEPLPQPSIEELLEAAQGGVLVFLDQVTDPHNVGAILRSASAFGAAGIVTTRRHAPPVTGVLAKAASGAIEHVPYCQVTNLAEALAAAKAAGFLVLGFDEGGEPLMSVPAGGGVALVLGAEGSGLRERTRELCDKMIRLQTKGAIGSLNVSNAAAVALYAIAALRE